VLEKPEEQGAHDVAPDDEMVPATQVEQLGDPTVLEYVPAGHGRQVYTDAYVPAGHA